jgi:hypothetical protein
MRKNLQRAVSLAALLFIVLPVGFFALSTPKPAAALNLWGDPFNNDIGYSSFNDIQMGKNDPRTIVANVINIALGLLGVLAIVLILMGGFKWMTAMGNDEKVGDAKRLLGAGVIGLLIVLSAYAVSIYIIRTYLSATGAISPSSGGSTYQLENTIAQ